MTAEREVARPGDGTDTWGDVLMVHARALLAAGRAITSDDAEALDLMQTTFEIALRRRSQLHDPAALRPWPLAIQTREAFRVLRRVRRHVRLERAVDPALNESPNDAERIAISTALRSLPPRTRAAVVLHHMVGLSVRETADALGVTDNGAKWHLKMGLARLREKLGDD